MLSDAKNLAKLDLNIAKIAHNLAAYFCGKMELMQTSQS